VNRPAVTATTPHRLIDQRPPCRYAPRRDDGASRLRRSPAPPASSLSWFCAIARTLRRSAARWLPRAPASLPRTPREILVLRPAAEAARSQRRQTECRNHGSQEVAAGWTFALCPMKASNSIRSGSWSGCWPVTTDSSGSISPAAMMRRPESCQRCSASTPWPSGPASSATPCPSSAPTLTTSSSSSTLRSWERVAMSTTSSWTSSSVLALWSASTARSTRRSARGRGA
jgi:hypothetical protein